MAMRLANALGLGALGSGGAVTPAAPSAPVWLSGTSSTPSLQLGGFPEALTTDDLIETQFSTASDFSSVEQDVTHTVTSGENGSDAITGAYSPLLTTATYYARDRYKLGAGQWSNWSLGTSQAIVVATNYRISSTGDRRISSAGNGRKYA